MSRKCLCSLHDKRLISRARCTSVAFQQQLELLAGQRTALRSAVAQLDADVSLSQTGAIKIYMN
jgi:hypothetical protein